MSTDHPPRTQRYRTAIIGLAVAVGLLGLKQGVDLVAGSVSSLIVSSVLYSLALAANFLAIVAAACGVGRVRRAGIGYALCGWGYLIFSSFEQSVDQPKPPLLTTLGFELVFGMTTAGSRGSHPDGMIWGAHSIAALAAGLLGASFAARLPRPDAEYTPITPWLDLVRSFRPAPVERPVRPEADPVHPLDRSD